MEVSGLHVYPVKSLRGVELSTSAVGLKGLRFDRHWMVIDENGRFRTQRQLPQMTRIATSLDGGLTLSAEGCGRIDVPQTPQGAIVEGTVWNWTGPVQLVDPNVDRWLTEVLEMPCRLVTMAQEARRPAKVGDSQVAFPDAMPVLIAGEASLRELNATLDTPVPMNRFRANVVLRGSAPFEEDRWPGLRMGNLDFRFGRVCGRCLVTTTDQRTGVRHGNEEPLRTLARDLKIEGMACFGAYYSPLEEGQISVGDPCIGIDDPLLN